MRGCWGCLNSMRLLCSYQAPALLLPGACSAPARRLLCSGTQEKISSAMAVLHEAAYICARSRSKLTLAGEWRE